MKQMNKLILFFTKRELKDKNQIIVSCLIPTLLMLFMGIMGNNQPETQGYGFSYMTFLLPGIVVMSFFSHQCNYFSDYYNRFQRIRGFKKNVFYTGI